jgi:hypothetical protein
MSSGVPIGLDLLTLSSLGPTGDFLVGVEVDGLLPRDEVDGLFEPKTIVRLLVPAKALSETLKLFCFITVSVELM